MKALIFVFILSGCAMPGITISKNEQAACKQKSCTVWTPDELARLARKFYSDGYKAATQSGAKSL